MGLYDRYVLPRLINLSMQNSAARAERARFVPLASGAVLEIGLGSGLNVPFYSTTVRALYGLEPSAALQRMAKKRMDRAPFVVTLITGSAEAIPLDDDGIDSVVTTWTLCTIGDPLRALNEMMRVLKPRGQLLFIEHGRSPDAGVRAWQHRLNPLWRRVAGGCHLDRPIDALITNAGFDIEQIETSYTRGPRPFSYLYKGVARKPA